MPNTTPVTTYTVFKQDNENVSVKGYSNNLISSLYEVQSTLKQAKLAILMLQGYVPLEDLNIVNERMSEEEVQEVMDVNKVNIIVGESL